MRNELALLAAPNSWVFPFPCISLGIKDAKTVVKISINEHTAEYDSQKESSLVEKNLTPHKPVRNLERSECSEGFPSEEHSEYSEGLPSDRIFSAYQKVPNSILFPRYIKCRATRGKVFHRFTSRETKTGLESLLSPERHYTEILWGPVLRTLLLRACKWKGCEERKSYISKWNKFFSKLQTNTMYRMISWYWVTSQ